MTARFQIEVERFALPQGGGSEIVLDDLGLLATAGTTGSPGTGGLMRVADLESERSFCLLGEPGAGKTTALRSIVQGIPSVDDAEAGQDAVLWVPMGEVADSGIFREQIALPVRNHVSKAEAACSGGLTVVLDGLDECPMRGGGKVLAGLLRGLLRDTNVSLLRVLVGCRSAEFHEAVHNVLAAALGTFARYELAPLGLRDVRRLSESRGLDPDEFMREVARTGTGPLASLPLTLDLLLKNYSAARSLRGFAAELYETALRALAGEHDTDRDPARVLASAEQVFIVAARLCCYLLLCGRAAFWTGGPGEIPDGDLDPYSLGGGKERQDGGTFDVTRQVIDAALQSALFTTRGSHRVIPAHASFAAFLAARYLAWRELPEVQLRTLLTVSTPAGSGLAPALRETAAWLIALRPQTADWMSGTDLARLAAYAANIPDPRIRRLMTGRMLADPEAFLSGGWRQARNLAHPHLAAQVLPVLTALADASAAQPSMGQSYVALTLASEAAPDAVLPSLLAVATRTDLDASRRALAGRVAATLDDAAAAPVLQALIAEVTAHPERDPDDEIRGTALDELWPRYLTAEQLTDSLTRPKRDNFIGAYRIFRRSLPSRLSDSDVPSLLPRPLGDTADRSGDGSPARPDREGEDLLEALVDRAFSCRDTAPVIGRVADVAARQLLDYGSPRVPAALDQRDATGAETGRSRRLRRQLAIELVTRYAGQQDIGWLLAWGWEPSRAAETRYADAVHRGQDGYPPPRRGLADAGDIAWLTDMALAGSPQEAEAYVPLLRGIFDPANNDAQETAYRVRETALWPAFAFWFDPVIPGSEEADVHKRVHGDRQPRRPAWDGASAHLARVLDRYEQAPGDTAAFAELLHLLQFDPDTGHGTHSLDGDLTSRPGIRALPQDEWPGQLADAARNYLAQAAPSGMESLDQPGKLSWLDEVGYLALAYLKRREQAGDASSATDASTIAAWAVPVLVFPERVDNGIKRVLLARLAEAAPDLLPGLIARLITAHIAADVLPTRLESLDAAWTRSVGDVLVEGIQDAVRALTDADSGTLGRGSTAAVQQDQRAGALRRTITVLVRTLAQYAHPPGIQAAFGVIDRATPAEPGDPLALAARAAALGLLHADAGRHWDDLIRRLAAAPPLYRAVLEDLADDASSPVLDGLADSQLAALWTQLSDIWSYRDDPPTRLTGRIGRDEQARRYRDGVLAALTRRGTSDAVRLLRQVAETRPDLPWLTGQVRQAEETLHGQQWQPLRPRDLTQILESSSARLVRSSADLAELVARTISEAAEKLTSTGYLLWDKVGDPRAPTWRPKSEPEVGGWLHERLEERLARSGVVINREVLVRQTASAGLGLAVDIQADAPASAPDVEPARCRIELKGNWHKDLMVAMQTQLAEDYLIPDGLEHGIYVTAWFDTQLWNDSADSRHGRAAARDRDDTEQQLAAQAKNLRELGLQVYSVIIDIPRPAPSARAADSNSTKQQ